MRLLRYGEPGREKPGLLLSDGTRIDTSEVCSDYNETFFESSGPQKLALWLENNRDSAPRVDADARLGPPIARPSKIICVGLNYRAHAAETGAKLPTEPKLFGKATSAFSGPFDSVVIPRDSEHTDWEVELAVVIGQRAAYVDVESALDYVAGYSVMNDYSERKWQKDHGGQWIKGKSFDTFAPLGPYLVTPDEIDDVQALPLWLKVNNEIKQQSSTSDMVFDVRTIVSYVSQCMSLLPGDVISTGTPSGVGLGHTPPIFLKPGDTVTLGIDAIGEMTQTVVACKDSRNFQKDPGR